MLIVAIAGGTGTGKSTLSYRLADKYPKIIEVLNFDDYQKVNSKGENLSKLHGMINWDHPDVIRWEKLTKDLNKLKSGNQIKINTWAHKSNPNYFKHNKMIKRTVYPKNILILEGYLTLWNKDLRRFFCRSYFLDAASEIIVQRRSKFADNSKRDYEKNILIPMHKKYVQPTKKYADLVINVSKINELKIFITVENDLKSNRHLI